MAAAVALNAACAAPGAAVCVDGLVKRHKGRAAVAGLSLRIERGELYGVIGPDGAGKSSLFKAVAGVLAFDAGTLSVFGQRIASERDAERVKSRIGFMPQGLGLNLYPDLTVQENVDFFAELRGVPRAALDERRARLLEMTHLDAFGARPMKQLSGGMKQKLGLVCTLIHEPELIVLDEPTTGVDPLSRRDFWQLLPMLMRERGLTALVSTAYLDEASRFDRVGLMYQGALLAEGEPEALRHSLDATIVSLPAPSARAAARLAAAFGAAAVQYRGADACVLVGTRDADRARAQVSAALDDVTSAAVQAREPDMEDLFVARVRAAETAPPFPSPAPAPRLRDAATKAAIEARHLTRDFGPFRAVADASFRVEPGEIFGLLGANGAGKTTIIKMLTGILPPSDGVGQVAGADMRRAPRDIRQRIGYMSQAFSLYADLSVRENLALYAGVYGLRGRDARRRMADIIELGGLGARLAEAAGGLPMGLRQRLALGCALLHRPQVLFLDEPTAGVDPLGRRHFWSILTALARDEQVAILLTTHHMAEADLCDHLVLMYDGRVVADATPSAMKRQLREQAGELLEVRCDDPRRAHGLLVQAGFGDALLHGRGVRLQTLDAAATKARVAGVLRAGGVELRAIVTREIGMDDVFVHRVGELRRAAA